MKVLAFDMNPVPALPLELGFDYAALEAVLAQCDILTLHVPAVPSTYHLISTDEFALMKKGSIVINTSRGSTVDIEALLHALADGTIASAGLDVLPKEPAIREEAELLSSFFRKTHDLSTMLADHILLRMRNVYITPHNAFNTREAVTRILETTVGNINAFIFGHPHNLIS